MTEEYLFLAEIGALGVSIIFLLFFSVFVWIMVIFFLTTFYFFVVVSGITGALEGVSILRFTASTCMSKFFSDLVLKLLMSTSTFASFSSYSITVVGT